MRCPQCNTEIRPGKPQIPGPCPNCGIVLHSYDKWHWPRGIICAAIDLLIIYRWYPLNGSLESHLKWDVVAGAIYLGLLFVSFRLVPSRLALVPQDEPIQLNL